MTGRLNPLFSEIVTDPVNKVDEDDVAPMARMMIQIEAETVDRMARLQYSMQCVVLFITPWRHPKSLRPVVHLTERPP
jgi:hypothetical protein